MTAEPCAAILTINLLGKFRVTTNGRGAGPIVVSSTRSRALLAYLAMRPDGAELRDKLAALLWGDRPKIQARQSLRQCLLCLRKELGDACKDALVTTREVVILRPDLVEVDARRLRDHAGAGAPVGVARPDGVFLEDGVLDAKPFDDWVTSVRAELHAVLHGRTAGSDEHSAPSAGVNRGATAPRKSPASAGPLAVDQEDDQRSGLAIEPQHPPALASPRQIAPGRWQFPLLAASLTLNAIVLGLLGVRAIFDDRKTPRSQSRSPIPAPRHVAGATAGQESRSFADHLSAGNGSGAHFDDGSTVLTAVDDPFSRAGPELP